MKWKFAPSRDGATSDCAKCRTVTTRSREPPCAKPIQWLVERMIPRAAVTLIAGEPGSYKSWLALRLAKSVAEGAAFLERACPALPVLYLDRENPRAVVRERMQVLEIRGPRLEAGKAGWETQGFGPQPQDSSLQPPVPSLKIWGGWLPDEPPAIGDARLVQIARRWKPLIIFDSLNSEQELHRDRQ